MDNYKLSSIAISVTHLMKHKYTLNTNISFDNLFATASFLFTSSVHAKRTATFKTVVAKTTVHTLCKRKYMYRKI